MSKFFHVYYYRISTIHIRGIQGKFLILFITIKLVVILLAECHVIYRTQGRIFDLISKHQEVEKRSNRHVFNHFRGVSKSVETRLWRVRYSFSKNPYLKRKLGLRFLKFLLIKITFQNDVSVLKFFVLSSWIIKEFEKGYMWVVCNQPLEIQKTMIRRPRWCHIQFKLMRFVGFTAQYQVSSTKLPQLLNNSSNIINDSWGKYKGES